MANFFAYHATEAVKTIAGAWANLNTAYDEVYNLEMNWPKGENPLLSKAAELLRVSKSLAMDAQKQLVTFVESYELEVYKNGRQ